MEEITRFHSPTYSLTFPRMEHHPVFHLQAGRIALIHTRNTTLEDYRQRIENILMVRERIQHKVRTFDTLVYRTSEQVVSVQFDVLVQLLEQMDHHKREEPYYVADYDTYVHHRFPT